MKKITDKFVGIFNEYSDYLKKSESSILFDARCYAAEKLKIKGLPTSKDEAYRNTGVEKIFDTEYKLNVEGVKTKVNLAEYFKCEVKNMDSHTILFSNGLFYDDNSCELPAGVIVCGLKEACKNHKDIFEKYYNRQAKESVDGFVQLNTMLATDGLFVYVPENVHFDKALQIINLTHGFGEKNIIKRNLVVLDKNSSLTMVVCDHTLGCGANFTNDVTESFVEDGARLTHYTIQNEPEKTNLINTHLLNLGAASYAESFVMSLHGGLIRNNIDLKFLGEHSNADLLGLYLIDRSQVVENHTLIDHQVSNCISNELYKGILDDQALSSFMGKIIVRPDAQKTEAYQTNRNICLTKDAHIRTKPQLEIYADDVKCSHGATVGQLDENALYYMRQRGIGLAEAKQMLMFAFANDILMKIQVEPLRERISGLIESRLRGELSECSNCLLNCSGK